jgi:hypothetical protein
VYCLHACPKQPLGQDLQVDQTILDFCNMWLKLYFWMDCLLVWTQQSFRIFLYAYQTDFTYKWPWFWRSNYWFFLLYLAITLLLVNELTSCIDEIFFWRRPSCISNSNWPWLIDDIYLEGYIIEFSLTFALIGCNLVIMSELLILCYCLSVLTNTEVLVWLGEQ